MCVVRSLGVSVHLSETLVGREGVAGLTVYGVRGEGVEGGEGRKDYVSLVTLV